MLNIPLRTRSILSICLALSLSFLAFGEASPADQQASGTCRALKELPSAGPNAIAWITAPAPAGKAKLDQWCDTVGPALLRAPRKSQAPKNGRILLVDWNVNVGNGNLESLIAHLQADEQKAGRGEPDFVFLLQEAFRRGPDVPATVEGVANVPSRIASSSMDIEAVATKLDWWLFYAPSMRNGEQTGVVAEDRGNAILSTLPIEGLQAIELPFSVQRRVALAATVHDEHRGRRFHVATVHLDTRAPWSRGSIFGAAAARNRQARWMIDTLNQLSDDRTALIIGGDLNSYWGPLESAVDSFARVAPRLNCGTQATHATGFTLDHLFARFTSEIDSAACTRAPGRFNSDHYPIVLPL
jgi:endonuclease/exonuclease/phosphatase family metal-dependent hydrolase